MSGGKTLTFLLMCLYRMARFFNTAFITPDVQINYIYIRYLLALSVYSFLVILHVSCLYERDELKSLKELRLGLRMLKSLNR